MEEQFSLFESILHTLNSEGVLNEIALIGSWCLPVYKEKYGKALDYMPTIRTTDLDFFVIKPRSIKKECNISSLLQSMDFVVEFDRLDGFEKFSHKLLEVEFLAPRSRDGEKINICKPYNIKMLSLNYLETIPHYLMTVDFRGVKLKVPELPFFMLHKAMIQTMRKNELKVIKDAQIVTALGEIVVQHNELKERTIEIFEKFPKKWKTKIKGMIKEYSPELDQLLGEL